MARPAKKSAAQWTEEILQAAQSLFITKGYEETSVNDIMNLVGGAKGMFYHSFQSKEELLHTLVDEWAAQYVRAITLVLCDRELSFSEKLIRIPEVIRQMSQKTKGLEAFFSKSNEALLRRLTDEMTTKLIPVLSSTLQDGVVEGILSINDTNFYASFLVHGALGALSPTNGTPREEIPRKLSYLPELVANTLNINHPDAERR